MTLGGDVLLAHYEPVSHPMPFNIVVLFDCQRSKYTDHKNHQSCSTVYCTFPYTTNINALDTSSLESLTSDTDEPTRP